MSIVRRSARPRQARAGRQVRRPGGADGVNVECVVATAARARARLLGPMLALLASAGCGAAALSTADVESAQTAARVMTALVNDPDLGTLPIDVRVNAGVVRLSGRVRTPAEAARALELAGAVPGVTRVDSRLLVGADPVPAGPPGAATLPERRPSRDPAAEFAELERSGGRLAVGASLGSSHPAAAGAESAWSISPLVRFGSGAGLGPAMGFDWYRARLSSPDPGLPSSRLRVRPVMAGLAYTLVAGPVSVSPSLLAGYAFNRIDVPEAGAASGLAVDVRNSLAWRPGVSMWIATSRRTAAQLSVGQLRTRLKVTYVDGARIDERSVDGHATTVSVGFAYTLF